MIEQFKLQIVTGPHVPSNHYDQTFGAAVCPNLSHWHVENCYMWRLPPCSAHSPQMFDVLAARIVPSCISRLYLFFIALILLLSTPCSKSAGNTTLSCLCYSAAREALRDSPKEVYESPLWNVKIIDWGGDKSSFVSVLDHCKFRHVIPRYLLPPVLYASGLHVQTGASTGHCKAKHDTIHLNYGSSRPDFCCFGNLIVTYSILPPSCLTRAFSLCAEHLL